MSHFEERMEADLQIIRGRLWKIGEDVDAALHSAKKVMILRDSELAYQTVLGDYPINRASRECDRLCHTFIARHLPGAGPLREMAATAGSTWHWNASVITPLPSAVRRCS